MLENIKFLLEFYENVIFLRISSRSQPLKTKMFRFSCKRGILINFVALNHYKAKNCVVSLLFGENPTRLFPQRLFICVEYFRRKI